MFWEQELVVGGGFPNSDGGTAYGGVEHAADSSKCPYDQYQVPVLAWNKLSAVRSCLDAFHLYADHLWTGR